LNPTASAWHNHWIIRNRLIQQWYHMHMLVFVNVWYCCMLCKAVQFHCWPVSYGRAGMLRCQCETNYTLFCIGSEKAFAFTRIVHMCRYPEGDLDTNLTIVITNVGADFTRLGSFGDAEQFGGTLVAQMDRSYLNRSWNKPKTPVQARHSV